MFSIQLKNNSIIYRIMSTNKECLLCGTQPALDKEAGSPDLLTCETCDMWLEEHRNELTLTKLKSWLKANNANAKRNKKYYSEVYKHSKKHCDCCNKDITISGWTYHLKSKKHVKNFNKKKVIFKKKINI